MSTRDHGPTTLSAAGLSTDVDESVPQSARIYDYLLGGRDNYPADRVVGEAVMQRVPALPVMVRAQRAFLARAVRYQVHQAGIRQFLDIGTGIPTANNVHEVAQAADRSCRVVYVDNDPIVLVHARALMSSSSEGATAFIQADVRRPDSILDHPTLAATLDLDRPIGLMMLGITHHLPDEDQPYDVVQRLVDRLPVGSHVTVAGPGLGFAGDEAMQQVGQVTRASGVPFVLRTRADYARFLDGLAMVEPGVVPIPLWNPDSGEVPEVYGWAGMARKDDA